MPSTGFIELGPKAGHVLKWRVFEMRVGAKGDPVPGGGGGGGVGRLPDPQPSVKKILQANWRFSRGGMLDWPNMIRDFATTTQHNAC